jgi:uncharacterized damage-inducible protein DinB
MADDWALEQLVEAWGVNHRVTMRLLGELGDDALRATLSTRGGRDVARQLAHVHDVRMSRVTKADEPTPITFAKGESPPKEALVAALEQSARAVEAVIRRGWANGGQVGGFKRGVIPFVAYLVAHESHHRGNVLLTLKQTGHKLGDELRWGIWEWNKI